ncbi:putative Chemotaxis protein [Pararobbsia alpina]|uniref:hypothetical protein n=1 Tax=Pararobbsia alpina TaxID=621374 RepID=UPI0039A60948
MTAVTRYEFDAHLNAVETRLGSKFDAYLEHQKGRDEAFQERLHQVEERVDLNIANMKKDVGEIKDDNKTMRYWLLGTTVTTVLGVASINASMLSNMKTFFDSGMQAASRVNDSRTQSASAVPLSETRNKNAVSTNSDQRPIPNAAIHQE